jgi:hypothetical protein
MPTKKTLPRTPARKAPRASAAKRAPAAKAAAKTTAMPKAVKMPKPGKALKTDKADKAGKPPKLHRKPVRDSFTMPEADFALIATLKARALAGQRETKKSELLRAGLHALAALSPAELVAALGQLDPVKIGRPKKTH